jgi:hypothetical protein
MMHTAESLHFIYLLPEQAIIARQDKDLFRRDKII